MSICIYFTISLMSDSRRKFLSQAVLDTPVSLSNGRLSPVKPETDRDPVDQLNRMRIQKGLLLLNNAASRKAVKGHAFFSILETAWENDYLFPQNEDIAVMTQEERQEWNQIVSKNSFAKVGLVSGYLSNRLENQKHRDTLVLESLKDSYFEVKQERQEKGAALQQFASKLVFKRVVEGFRSLVAVGSNKKMEEVNRKLTVLFVKIVSRGLKNTINTIYSQFLQELKERRRAAKESSMLTLKMQSNAIVKILSLRKDLDVKGAYYRWMLKTTPGEKLIANVADQIALYDKINLETAAWRLFRLRPRKVEINQALRRKVMLFSQILGNLLSKRLSTSLSQLLVAGFQSKKLDVVRRIMIMALRKEYLSFNIWHRKVLKKQLKSAQTNKVSKISSYFNTKAEAALSGVKNSFKAFQDILSAGHKKKVDALQKLVTANNNQIHNRFKDWRNYVSKVKAQENSGQLLSVFETVNNRIKYALEKIFDEDNENLKARKIKALEKLFSSIGNRRRDGLNIWAANVRKQINEEETQKNNTIHSNKLKQAYAKILINSINERKRNSLIEAMAKFKLNEERKKKIKWFLEKVANNLRGRLQDSLRRFGDLRLARKSPLEDEDKVSKCLKLERVLTNIASNRLRNTFKCFEDEMGVARDFKYKCIMRLMATVSEMRKRMYTRWSRVVLEDQSTRKSKSVNDVFELLFGTIKGLTSNAIYHNNERRKKEHALVRIFRNLMLNEGLAFQQWNKISLERLLFVEKKGRMRYLQTMKLMVQVDILAKNRIKDAFDKIIEFDEKRKAEVSSRGVVFYNGLQYLLKYRLRRSFNRFLECRIEAAFKKLKLVFVMQEFQLLNREKALCMWRVKQSGDTQQQDKSQVVQQTKLVQQTKETTRSKRVVHKKEIIHESRHQ